MKLWIDHAHQKLAGANTATCSDAVGISQTEELFIAFVASGKDAGYNERLVQQALPMLCEGRSLDTTLAALLGRLPANAHVPISILRVNEAQQAQLAECDAPPLFMVRDGQLVLLPVIEEETHGRLIRQCQFTLQDGDHLAIVSEGYIQAQGWDRRWGWRDIAASVRRLTDLRCDARQLLTALVSTYRRLAQEDATRDVAIIALFVRPLRTVTVWTGPPDNPDMDELAVEKLLAEPSTRIICGGTTADIAARVMGTELKMEPRPAEGWKEIPPASQLEGMDLVTEGLVTMTKARERISGVERARDLPSAKDGATRLARELLHADKIHFLVGLAVNPAQAADAKKTIPMRQVVVQELAKDLKTRGKSISIEYIDAI